MKFISNLTLLIQILLCSQEQTVVSASSTVRRRREERASSREQVEIEPRIVGGKPVSGSNFPSYAIPIGGPGLCGASLIHEDILISAGHCSGIFEGYKIALGASELSGSDASEVILAEKELVNPEFNMYTLENDSLLIKLASPASAPVLKWNTDSSVPAAGDTVRVIGFGATVSGGRPSNQLLEVNLEIVGYQTCYKAYDQPFWGSPIVESKMICAGRPATSQTAADSCQGDSGGPMMDSDGKLVGIVSFGSGCGENGIPGVYTRVSSLSNFIREGICELSSSPPSYCKTLPTSSPVSSGGNEDGGSGTTDDFFNNLFGFGDASTDSPTPTGATGDNGPPAPSPSPVDNGSSSDQCTVGCTFAWVFTGVVLHQGTGSSCTEICALTFIQSFLSDGYKCGLCS